MSDGPSYHMYDGIQKFKTLNWFLVPHHFNCLSQVSLTAYSENASFPDSIKHIQLNSAYRSQIGQTRNLVTNGTQMKDKYRIKVQKNSLMYLISSHRSELYYPINIKINYHQLALNTIMTAKSYINCKNHQKAIYIITMNSKLHFLS